MMDILIGDHVDDTMQRTNNTYKKQYVDNFLSCVQFYIRLVRSIIRILVISTTSLGNLRYNNTFAWLTVNCYFYWNSSTKSTSHDDCREGHYEIIIYIIYIQFIVCLLGECNRFKSRSFFFLLFIIIIIIIINITRLVKNILQTKQKSVGKLLCWLIELFRELGVGEPVYAKFLNP